MGKSIIGKYYKPIDNSYSVNLTSASTFPYENKQQYLAGNKYFPYQICKIVSEPFVCKIKGYVDLVIEVKMILVEFDNITSSVLYYEDSVMDVEFENGIPCEWLDDELL